MFGKAVVKERWLPPFGKTVVTLIRGNILGEQFRASPNPSIV